MRRFTDAGRASIKSGNLYSALSLALMLPDICASLEDPGPGKTQKRYERWCKRWLEPKFRGSEQVFLSAEDCFQLRCSLVHSGSAEIDAARRAVLDRFVFFDGSAGPHLIWVEGNTVNGVKQPTFLQLKADCFSETIFDAADEWDKSVVADESVQKEKQKLLVIHPAGQTVGGVTFGSVHPSPAFERYSKFISRSAR